LSDKQMKLTVLCIGEVGTEAAQQVLHGLSKAFPEMTCFLSESVMPIPIEAYNKARRQYHSTRLLAKLTKHVEKSGVNVVLGVTSLDLTFRVLTLSLEKPIVQARLQ